MTSALHRRRHSQWRVYRVFPTTTKKVAIGTKTPTAATLAISRVLTVWTSCVIKVASRKQLFTPKMADAQ